jgi:tetratricopeptide (TPR) repeat protein
VGAFQRAHQAPELPALAETLALAEASALFKLGRYAEVKHVLQVFSACSEIASCLLLGSSQALSSDLPAAVSSFQAAVRLAPQNADAYFRLALVFLQGQRDAEAKDTLTVGLDAVPNSPLLLYGQALLYEHLGSYDSAIDSAMKSGGQDPSRAEVWSLLGTLHAHEGHADLADEAFHKALSLDASVDHSVEYADFLIQSGRYGEAEKLLNGISESNQDNPAINRSLGKLYKSEGKFDQAETFLSRSVREDPKDPGAHYALAMTLERLHRDAEAKKELDLFGKAKEERRFVHALEAASDPVAAKK